MSSVPTCVPYEAKKPYTKGKCKALFIGINYTGTSAELHGCVNDVADMIQLLERLNFPLQEAVILVDDPRFPNNCGLPTHDNIIRSMQWLTKDARSGDLFFLHFSGHGTQITSAMRNQNEPDGLDEAIVPCDYDESGLITDDTIFRHCARALPSGARLTALMDCCHSGSLMDLPFCATVSDSTFISYSPSTTNMCAGDVVMISGCSDPQTSSDAIGANFKVVTDSTPGRAGGACTGALQDTIMNNVDGKKLTFAEVLSRMRDSLKDRGYKQIPQLSCSKVMKVDAIFDLRGDVSTEDLSKIEDISVEVTTTVKPQPVLTTEGSATTVSYTPYTFTFPYPYTKVNQHTVPSNYWYYDPYMAAAAAAATESSSNNGDSGVSAAAGTSSWLANAYNSFAAYYNKLPTHVAATVTEVDTMDEFEEDPADVGNKTIAALLAESPQRPTSAIEIGSPTFDFESLPNGYQQLVEGRPGDWRKNPESLIKPVSYREFRKEYGERDCRASQGGYGAGSPWYERLGETLGLSRGRNRADGHGARIALPVSASGAEQSGGDEFIETILRKGFGLLGFGQGGDDKGKERRDRLAQRNIPRGPRQAKNHRSHEGHHHHRPQTDNDYATPSRGQIADESETGNTQNDQEASRSQSRNEGREVQVFDNRPPKHRPNPPRGGPPKGYGKGSPGKKSFYDRIGSFVIPTDDDDLRELFATFDSDGDGKIDLDEFVTAMVDFQSQMGLELSVTDARKTFSKFDSNQDGRLNFDEFSVYMLALAKM